MNIGDFKEMKFDIQKDSEQLRELVSMYESDGFLGQIAVLLSMIEPPIPYKPFHVMDSPMKMLTYMAGLNLCSSNDNRKPYEYYDKEWERIIMQMVKVKAGYFQLFLPPENADKEGYHKFYRVSMPVFMDYFDTGPTNFEEQEIERIQRIFSAFDAAIITKFGLKTRDFIEIYDRIDHSIFLNLNRDRELLKNPACKEFWDEMARQDIAPCDWKYEGNDKDILEVIRRRQNLEEEFIIEKNDLTDSIGSEKVESFLKLFLSNFHVNDKYLYYTQDNFIMSHPLYEMADGRLLVVHCKQLLKAIYDLLDDFCRGESSVKDRFFKQRGRYLQEKTVEVIKKHFSDDGFVYNEYKTDAKAQDRQDVLLLCKGLSLILEIKAGDRVVPHRETMKAFEQIYLNFKRNIQKGYEQASRIKKLFDSKTDFSIFNDKGELLYSVNTGKFHHCFTIIVTLDKFGPAQYDLTQLLKLEEHEDYPLSICIDDLETLLLTMKKRKVGVGDLIRFLTYREELQGRLRITNELQIWGQFLKDPKFRPSDDPQMHFKPGEQMDEVFDEVYQSGLGLLNERNLDKKKSKRWMTFNHSQIPEMVEQLRKSSVLK